MSSKHVSDAVYTDKRVPKNEIKFRINLNEEQKECKRVILENKITFIQGQAGSGKTLVATMVALDLLFKKQVKKIIITRPMITAGEDWGFLPGDLAAKIGPFLDPIYDNMYTCYGKEKIDKLVQEGVIEIVPFAFMRGRNFSDAIVIGDELQNCTLVQLKMFLSRMCKGSKVVITGDITQVDLPKKSLSGFKPIFDKVREKKDIGTVTLKENHRDPIVEEILKSFEELGV